METIILFAPLLGALIAGFGWRVIGEAGAQYLTTGLLFLAAILSWVVFLSFDGVPRHIHLLDWIVSGDFSASWGIRIDRLTAIMLVVVNSVSALVHLYSTAYMAHDENFAPDGHYKARFFAYLSLFTFTMLMLVTADNLLQLFFGWEGVGLASYLLIGFYYRKESAAAAAMKAFVVNRVGDFCFLLGIFGLFWLTGSIGFDAIFAQVPELAETRVNFLWMQVPAADLLAILLFGGAMGKSAQLGLHTWLPDAMEGPTPVSALIHAATMVTAGVFLVCRMSPLYEFAPHAKMLVMYVGATTAFFAATVGLVQNDIKRVIAYSTCSQLGYMFVAAGAGVYSAAMFHLFTHAFFKALLFLGAGSVITAMHHEQDMRNYGGLRKKLPITFWTMMIGTLAITGVGIPLTTIGFAGFLSKDAIIESAFASGNSYAFWMLVIAALMTSFYSWRLMFLTFWGKPRGDHHAHDHAHESGRAMTIPLVTLAVGAVFAGMVWYQGFFGDKVGAYFHMPAVAEASHGEDHGADAGHAAEASAEAAPETAAAPAEGTEAAADTAHADASAETATADAAHAETEHAAIAVSGEGAIYMHPGNHVMHDAHGAPAWVKTSPFVVMLIGLALAYYMYMVAYPRAPQALAHHQQPLYRFLLNKWYFDEVYNAVFVRGANWLGRVLWKQGDGRIIDGAINGVALGVIPRLTRRAQKLQSGYVTHYALAMVLGLVVLLTWATVRGMN